MDVHSKMFPQSICLREGKVTLVAFVKTFIHHTCDDGEDEDAYEYE